MGRGIRISQAIRAAAGGCCALLTGCALLTPPEPPPAISVEVYRRAESERADRLEKEVAQLKADLRQAEEALVSAESGLRGRHSRADAVSSLAEARIQVERASQAAPWRASEVAEARRKLEDADGAVRDGHFGSALFFVYRARRTADRLQLEAKQVNQHADARFVRSKRVNLRSGPSTDDSIITVLAAGTPVFPESRQEDWFLVRTTGGTVGWMHANLLEAR